ncbi:MAG: hypothetical protein NDI66_05465, partial [Pseudomonas sp.]|nr:hypothetical protein [Pseudomonas sp.]
MAERRRASSAPGLGARSRLLLALAWLAALLVAGVLLGQRLSLSGDLRSFMPSARTPAQKLLLDELGEGPGSRLLLLAVDGADPAALARVSDALRARLAGRPVFSVVANGGDDGLDAFPERLRPYRYLLTPSFDAAPLDRAALADALAARVQDLGSPAAALVEPLVPSDPTLETLVLAERWQPANAPQRQHGVWFDRDGRRALLMVETRAAGFDPTGQQAAIDAIHADFAAARAEAGEGAARPADGNQADDVTLTLSGPGAFSVEIGGRTAREARWIGTIDGFIFALLLWVAYRSWKAPLLGALPLATAGIAGLGAVALAFDAVHGITVAFGFTLIGVAQDYPIHFLSHQRAGLSPWASARGLWPTLRTGVASTCIAYLTFLVSGVDGLQQLAVFTIVGLATAALATRFALPALIDPAPRDAADSPRIARAWALLARLPRLRAPELLALAAVALAVTAFAPGAFWQNDLGKLTPVPADALARDAELRAALGAPDVRYLVALDAPDTERALQAVERFEPALQQLRHDGDLAGYASATRVLPSIATQRARQQALPDAAALQAMLDEALADSPFVPDAFAPFLADVDAARRAPPLRPVDLAGTPLATALAGQLVQRDDGSAVALVSLTGIADVTAVDAAARAAGAQLLDLKQASESLVAAYRERVLWALALAAVLLAATVWIALRA